VDAAGRADASAHESIPPFAADVSVDEQAEARVELARRLRAAIARVDAQVLALWAGRDAADAERAAGRLAAGAQSIAALRSDPLDADLLAIAADDPVGPAQISRQMLVLDEYLRVKSKWWGVFAFGAASQAKALLATWA